MSGACPFAEAERAPAAAGFRERLAASRRRSVEDVIGSMRERLGEPLSLRTIARAAASSPYHFDRVFRQVTGVPPFRFLAALRLDAARRLLLTTGYSATSICFEVGYSSVGSFTRQFAEAVGMPPARLRGFAAAETGTASLSRVPGAAYEAAPREGAEDGPVPGAGHLAGVVRAPEGFAGAIFVGVFPTPLPSGRPSACVLLREGGPFRIGAVPDGEFHVFAAGIPAAAAASPARALLQDDALRAAAGPVRVRGDEAAPSGLELVLRPRELVDPPILVSLPVLLAERLSRASADGADGCPPRRGEAGR